MKLHKLNKKYAFILKLKPVDYCWKVAEKEDIFRSSLLKIKKDNSICIYAPIKDAILIMRDKCSWDFLLFYQEDIRKSNHNMTVYIFWCI